MSLVRDFYWRLRCQLAGDRAQTQAGVSSARGDDLALTLKGYCHRVEEQTGGLAGFKQREWRGDRY